jgi:hypothetical protein
MSATGTLEILFQELRESIQNCEGTEAIQERYQAVVEEFPQLSMTDVVEWFEEWLKAREDEERVEREKARNFMNDHFKIISVM